MQAFPSVNYDQRYSLFKAVDFPKYKTYIDYEEATSKFSEGEMTPFDIAKKNFTVGKQVLTNLKETPKTYRCSLQLQDPFLDQIIKISVMNSLAISKAKMSNGAKMIVEIKYSQSLEELVMIDVYTKK